MLKTLKYKLLMVVATLTLAVPMILPVQTYASCANNISKSVGSGIDQATGSGAGYACSQGSNLSSGISTIAKKVVNIFSIIVGIVSVIMIIYAGFRYITSGGESGNVTNAKNTLIYAIIGLVIVVLAQLIVHYVLNTSSAVSSTSTGL